MLSFLLFIVVIVVLVLFATKKTDGQGNPDKYAQGYWDGYRALGEKIQPLLNQENLDKDAIKQHINLGYGGQEPEGPAVRAVAQPVEQSQNDFVATPVKVVDKQQQSINNMNTLLFVASLLFVAAGAAFVAAAMPDTIKLFGVWLLTGAFYGLGMMLRNTTRFKAAGTAFIGTSLGLIPFAGIALYQLADVPASLSWCITSLVGLVAYFFAAIRLKSQVVSYLTLAFVVSLASSFAESLSVPLMMNFVVIIGISLIINLIGLMKPSWVPAVFSEPIERTGQLVTPLALLASLTLADQLSLFAYEVVFGVAALHYVVVWLQMHHRLYETVVRVLVHITLLLVAIDIVDADPVSSGIAFLVLASLQQAYSLVRHKNDTAGLVYEWPWIHTMQFFQLISPLFWLTYVWNAELTAVAYILLGVSSLLLTLRSRRIVAALPGLLMSLVVPFVVAKWVIEPSLDWLVIAFWFMLAAGVISSLWRFIEKRSAAVRYFLIGSFSTYVGTAAIVGLLCDTSWSRLLVFSIITALLWRGSFAMKQVLMSVCGSVAFVVAVIQAWLWLEFDMTWLALGVAWFASLVLYLVHVLLLSFKDNERAFGALGMVWVTLGIAALAGFFSSETNIAAALTIVAGAATLAVEGYRRKNKTLVEAAVYVATFGLQCMVGIMWPELNLVLYAHWWALTLAAVAAWRHDLTTRLIIGMSFVTAASGMYALGEGGFYQLLFLVEHLALLVAGALTSKRWAIWWGLIASVLAVLYFLRDIAFLAFAFLGLVVIAIVVWRLSQHDEAKKTL